MVTQQDNGEKSEFATREFNFSARMWIKWACLRIGKSKTEAYNNSGIICRLKETVFARYITVEVIK